MTLRNCMTGLLIGSAVLAALLGGCKKQPQPPAEASVRLEKMDVPRKVFSLSGEVLAFRAAGEAGKKGKVKLSLDSLRARFAKFESAKVYEFNAAGKRLSQQTVRLGADASAEIEATAGSTYLAYAELGARYSNSYQLRCNLTRIGGRGELIPDICGEILCANQPFKVSEILTRYANLRDTGVLVNLSGDGEIGGFGPGSGDTRPVNPNQGGPVVNPRSGFGGGGACDRCLDPGGGSFIPVDECSFNMPQPSGELVEDLVFHHIEFTADDARGPTQIFKMKSDGSGVVNLSNNDNVERQPDVSPDAQKIAYVRDEELYVMGINGEDPARVSDATLVSRPKWLTLDREVFILYIRGNGDIYRVNVAGGNPVEVTSPGNQLSDVHVDRYTGKNIIFERVDSDRRIEGAGVGLDVFGNAFFNSDLFTKDVWDEDDPVQLTNTPDIIEALPTGANKTEYLVAYSVLDPRNKRCEVQVALIGFDDSSLTVQSTITLPVPADWGVNGISFSSDDTRLYISTRANNVTTTNEARKYEIFSVKLDGSEMRRLNTNTHFDAYPSGVPIP